MEPVKTTAREIAAKLMEHPEDEVYVCDEKGYWNPVETVSYNWKKFLFCGPAQKDGERLVFSIS